MAASSIRVLIVEDNPGDMVLARRMLEEIQSVRFTILQAVSLAGALSELAEPVDLVLLDLNLPDSRELETLRRLRAQNPSVPILVLTGMADRQKAVQALAEGAQDYLVKGQVNTYLLERAIFRHLNPPDSGTTPPQDRVSS
jgi:CheY-like chemotaxis protein